jgi:alpha-L-fucosidase 2
LFVAFLAGCASGPAALRLAGEETLTVHTNADIALPGVEALDAEGKAMPLPDGVAWTATPEGVVTVDSAAKTIKVVGDGTATVTVALGEIKDTVTINVAIPDQVAVDASGAAGLAVGGTAKLAAKVTSKGNEVPVAVTWSSSDAAIATVAEDGTVTAVAVGTATITAKAGELAGSADVTTVEAVAATPPAGGEGGA